MKTKKKRNIKKEVSDFLMERALMVKAGFPYCYVENFVEFHCNSCIEFYRKRKETHKDIDNVNIINNE